MSESAEHETDHDELIRGRDELVKSVARELPFVTELDADMGGTFTLQIDLGRRGDPDDSPDRAGIDPEADATWWFDVEGGRESIISDLKPDADPKLVARWIAGEARRVGSPAAAAPTTLADKLDAVQAQNSAPALAPVSASPSQAERGGISL